MKPHDPKVRASDLYLLRALVALDDEELTEPEQKAFADMLLTLDGEDPVWPTLTERQRDWVTNRADQLGIPVLDPAERNRNVPRGREVAPAPALLHKPLKPPSRKPIA